MERRLLIALLVIAVLVTGIGTAALTTIFFTSRQGIIRTVLIPMDVKVAHYMGINTDTDALHFGTLRPGERAERWVNISNSNTFPVRVTTRFRGDTAMFASADQDFVLEPAEFRSHSIMVQPGPDTPSGNYTGTALITIRRA